MTLKEAMAYRGENADTLAEKIGIRAGEITKWMRPAGLLRVPSARLQQLAVALDARGRGLWRRRERQAERVLPEGKLWRQAFELNKPFLFIIGVRGGRFGGLVYPLIL